MIILTLKDDIRWLNFLVYFNSHQNASCSTTNVVVFNEHMICICQLATNPNDFIAGFVSLQVSYH